MADNILRWLHLSDLHMRKQDLPQIEPVLKALWDDIPRQIEELGGPLDFIAFTGDVAYSGQAEEYTLAEEVFFRPLFECMKRIGHLRPPLYIVPGNHDVDHNLAVMVASRYKSKLKSASQVNAILGNAQARNYILVSMKDYADFVRRLVADTSSNSVARDPLYACVQTIEKANWTIAVLGLNSAWSSGLTAEKNLWIGERQILDALDRSKQAAIHIVLVHHSLDWLHELDQSGARTKIQKNCALMLHGHLHTPNIEKVESLAGETVFIPCGSVYRKTLHEEPEWLDGYNLVEFDLETGAGIVTLRRYSPRREEFVRDIQSTGDQANGFHVFTLRRHPWELRDDGAPTVMGPDTVSLDKAFRVTLTEPRSGHELYWSIYSRSRVQNRIGALARLAKLARFQHRWLEEWVPFINLYQAAALSLSPDENDKSEAKRLLPKLVNGDFPSSVRIDATFLLARLTEQTSKDEAIPLHIKITQLEDDLILKNQPPQVQEHLRGTIAKSYLNLADIYLDRGGTENLHVAEDYCLRGLQIASVLGNNPLEAVHLKLLSELMKRQGKSKEDIEGVSTKLHRIEGPARERFLAEALTRPEDQDSLYFTISALKHGLGYELQRVNVVVHPMGPAELEGIFTLRAMSMLAVIDAYLMTVPEGQAGVHFVGVESLTPEYTLSHRRHAREKSERIEIDINPVMRPGDILTYRWTARASEGAFATTTEQLTTAGLEFEHIAWQIIAPMRRLEIHATIPQQGENPLPCWFELWRMGPVPKPDTSSFALAAQTAYRALLKDESGAVQCDQELLPPDRRKLHLVVNYPWLAMRYVLAWKVE